MPERFLQTYAATYNSIPGFFTMDAALMFLVYGQLATSQGIRGDVLEIGVHHGRSAIVVASIAAPGRKFVAVDLFDELQDRNLSGSGTGNRTEFSRNMSRFFDDLSFVETIQAASSSVSSDAIGHEFSFCHIDGGHTPQETYDDLDLCCRVLMPGGLLAIDDYFNPAFPGVCEGAIQFKLQQGDKLKPIAIGFNKVIFQRSGTNFDLESAFSSNFPMIPRERSILWGQPASHFTSSFSSFLDLSRSTPQLLSPKKEGWVQAEFEPQLTKLRSKPGQTIDLPVKVTNKSIKAFPYGESEFGLSCHLLTNDESIFRYDNERSYFRSPLKPGESKMVELPVQAPNVSGSFIVELDIVWEGMLWFKESGNPTCKISLIVEES